MVVSQSCLGMCFGKWKGKHTLQLNIRKPHKSAQHSKSCTQTGNLYENAMNHLPRHLHQVEYFLSGPENCTPPLPRWN